MQTRSRTVIAVRRDWTDWAPPGTPSESTDADTQLLIDAAGLQARHYAIAKLRYFHEILTVVILFSWERGLQKPVEASPRSQDLSQPKLACDTTAPVQQAPPRHRDSDGGGYGIDAGPSQHFEQLTMGDYARSTTGQFSADSFVNIDVPALPPQQQCREQSGHGPSNHERFRPRIAPQEAVTHA
jgi:hypothetical protein